MSLEFFLGDFVRNEVDTAYVYYNAHSNYHVLYNNIDAMFVGSASLFSKFRMIMKRISKDEKILKYDCRLIETDDPISNSLPLNNVESKSGKSNTCLECNDSYLYYTGTLVCFIPNDREETMMEDDENSNLISVRVIKIYTSLCDYCKEEGTFYGGNICNKCFWKELNKLNTSSSSGLPEELNKEIFEYAMKDPCLINIFINTWRQYDKDNNSYLFLVMNGTPLGFYKQEGSNSTLDCNNIPIPDIPMDDNNVTFDSVARLLLFF